MRAVTRRGNSNECREGASQAFPGQITTGELTIDPGPRRASLGGQVLELTTIEFKSMHFLARYKGQVLTRDEILLEIASREHDYLDRSIDVHVSSLRRKLGDQAKSPTCIKTVRGFGCMFLDGPE